MNLLNYEEFCINKAGTYNLLPHQIKTIEHFVRPEIRGFLVYHGVGSGKTLTSIECARKTIEAYPDVFFQVFLVVPDFIWKNYLFELDKFEITDFRSKFKKLSYFGKDEDDEDLLIGHEEMIAKLREKLEGSIVIIDEVHLFNNEILRKNLQALAIFDAIKQTTTIKLLIMSGTPIYNTPFDASLLRNIMTLEDVFTRSGEEFEKRYTDPFEFQLYRVGEFREYFRGYLSYFKGFEGTNLIPENAGLFILNCELTPTHTELIQKSRNLERDLIAMSPYTSGFCPKFDELLKQLQIIYHIDSQHSSPKVREKVFIYCKFPEINQALMTYLRESRRGDFVPWNSGEKGIRFATVTSSNYGTLIPEFNQGNVDIIIGSEEVAVGVTLKDCRYCFILSVPDSFGQLEQIQGRVMRLCSHSGLPKEKRNIRFFLIISKYYGQNESLDIRNFEDIKSYHSIILDTLKYLKEASI